MGQCVSGHAKERKDWKGPFAAERRHHGCLATVKERRSRIYIARRMAKLYLYVQHLILINLKALDVEYKPSEFVLFTSTVINWKRKSVVMAQTSFLSSII
ncbi:hypothetical protein RJ639_022985 [Escallonia herrerae]|uniref:Uncharacterized protein n=1 Tax=Escallonia herrerae TaxID=1293975 RepID=A0AA88V1S9_9ASTE|nr:hypothetical protein RJ639_022985 [Escallonia herrerae]